MGLGVLIVTYNSAGHAGACLDALRRHGLFESADVLVVDNASSDGTAAEIRDVPHVLNAENRGFAAAVNEGLRRLTNPFVLLLNPDAVLQTNVDALVRDCNETNAAVAAGKLVNPAGEAQRGFQVRRFPTVPSICCEVLGINRLFPTNPINRSYRCLDLDPERSSDVEQPAGAFLLIRRSVWEEIGGFDERYFPLWFEEVDFEKRVADRGHRIRYVPDSIAVHSGAHSLASVPSDCRQLYWYSSLIRYASSHFSRGGGMLVCASIGVGIVLRTVVGMITQRSLRPIQACTGVLRLCVECLLTGQVSDLRTNLEGAGLRRGEAGQLDPRPERVRRRA